jgi:hypothetical protein
VTRAGGLRRDHRERLASPRTAQAAPRPGEPQMPPTGAVPAPLTYTPAMGVRCDARAAVGARWRAGLASRRGAVARLRHAAARGVERDRRGSPPDSRPDSSLQLNLGGSSPQMPGSPRRTCHGGRLAHALVPSAPAVRRTSGRALWRLHGPGRKSTVPSRRAGARRARRATESAAQPSAALGIEPPDLAREVRERHLAVPVDERIHLRGRS